MFRIVDARSAVIAVVLCCLTAAACGSSDDDAALPNTASNTAAPSTPTEDAGANTGRPFTADPTIVGARPASFTSWTRLAENRIGVNFESGAPECYGVDATATETATTVTIELRLGTRADAVGRMCTMIAVFGTLEVPLQAPLGTRQVLSAV